MALHWFLACHGLMTLLVAFSLFFGNWPIFKRTPIGCIHQFITYDAYDYFQRFVGLVFGAKGVNVILSVEHYCCDRPNPILQILYIAIVGGVYYIVAVTSFRHLPTYYLSEIHRYISFLAAAFGVLLYILASFTDPGVVTADNVSQYLSSYPYDNIIYKEKECSTCKIPKPARSKHCSICNRCVARFDHHCGWMNTCIGEKNTRYFLAFLFWHFLLCVYGAIAFCFFLAGKVKELRVIYILRVYYGVENSFRSLASHVLQWLMDAYDTQVLLTVFFSLCSLLLGGFFCYHAHLCLTNTTTNETFKWQDYVRWQKKVLEAKASAAALKAGVSESNTKEKPQKSTWKSFFRRSPPQKAEDIVKNNIYDKGYLHNVMEILCPPSSRSSLSQRKSKSR